MAEWSLGEWTSVIGLSLSFGVAGIGWIVERFSERWSNRVYGLAILWFVMTLVMAAMLWNEPVPTPRAAEGGPER